MPPLIRKARVPIARTPTNISDNEFSDISGDELGGNPTNSLMIFKPTDQPASQIKKRKANSPIKPPNPTPITIDETTDLRTIIERLGMIIGSLPEHQHRTIDKAI